VSIDSAHLDLADLLAEVDGGAAGAAARAHLAACATCRAETASWAAVAAGVRYLAAGLQVPAGASAEPPIATGDDAGPARGHGARPARRQRQPAASGDRTVWPRRRALVAAGSAAAVVVALLVILLPGHARLTRPLHSPWQAARELPGAGVFGAGSSGRGWRLASYLVSAGWKQNTAGPEPGYLTCPTARTCYVEGDNSTSASGPADMDSFYVSASGGLSWSVLPVPAGLTFSSALSCSTAVVCAAGGVYNGQPVFARTVDGGHSWTVDPLPVAANGVIFQLTCPTVTRCAGLLTTSPSQLPPSQQYYGGVSFLQTGDGGRHFSSSAFPAGQAMQALSCARANDCVAVGVSSADLANLSPGRGFVQMTTDGGATWTPGSFPAGLSPGPFPQVACPDAGDCYLLGATNREYGYGGVARSADGGRTWTLRPLPADVPQPGLSAISCPTASTCYVSGTEAVPQRYPKGCSVSGSSAHRCLLMSGGSAMILTTTDGGQDWGRVTFPLPARISAALRAAGAFEDIGGIQCPHAGICVALGASTQGSRSTPVYTEGIAP
jgi:photosystem II stability/assembly factor-like uncharacterized protein